MGGYRTDPVHRALRRLRAAGPGGPGPLAAALAGRLGVGEGAIELRPGLTNYKPFERARVVVEARVGAGGGGEGCRHLLYLHVAPGAAAALRPPGAGHEPLVLQGGDAVAWMLPDAPGLPALGELLGAGGVARLAAGAPELAATGAPPVPAPELVRYVPTKRALLVWRHPGTGRRYWLKAINAAEAAAAALNLREVWAWHERGALAPAVPRPVRYDPALHALVMSEVPGRPFTRLMARPGRREPFAEVGRALAALHATPTVPWRAWSFAQEHQGLRRHMRGVVRALPALAGRVGALLDRLEATAPGGGDGFAPVHGNLFGDQILYDAAAALGRRVGIVDWDAWCHGDPHFDLGRLIAHAAYLARLRGLGDEAVSGPAEALLEGYRAAAGRGAVDRERLDWQTATALLLRAKISSLRKLAPGWTRHVALMVDEAERVVGPHADPRRRRARRPGAGDVAEVGP